MCCHRFDRPRDYLLHPVSLTDRLPVFNVPLLPEDGVVALDLQAAFDQAYDSGPYRREVRYLEEAPDARLPPRQMRWTRETLANAMGRMPAWK